MEIKDFIYNRITELQGNLSDREVSKRIGKNLNYLQNMKRQRTMPSIDTLVALCRVFRISLSEFFATAKTNISDDEVNFYNNLKAKINPNDYELLSKVADVADEEDLYLLTLLFKKHISPK